MNNRFKIIKEDIEIIKNIISNPNESEMTKAKKVNEKVNSNYKKPFFVMDGYTTDSNYLEEDTDMQKAKDTTKLIKKTIINKLGKQQTVYFRIQ